MIAAQGGNTGGWSLYANEGRLRYAYSFTGARLYTVSTDAALPPGTHQVRAEFAYEGGGVGKGGPVTLDLDEPATQPVHCCMSAPGTGGSR